MVVIKEDYVSFEMAKLLKKKGFDGECSKVWIYSKSIDLENNAQLVSSIYFWREPIIDNADVYKGLTIENRYGNAYLCPTLQMATKWLREVHNLFIDSYYDCDFGEGYKFSVHKLPKGTTIEPYNENYPTYEEAVEVALKYCLENLI